MNDDIEVVRRALMMRDAGYGEPTQVWEQVGSLLKEHDRLRATLVEAERERDGKSIQITELQEQAHRLYGVEQRAERAEADLSAAREVICRAVAWCDDYDIDDSWTEDARAFLERTATDATDPG